MQIDDLETIKNDVNNFFKDRYKLEYTKLILLEQRYFSHIYEIQLSDGASMNKFILKISTTNRSCKDEYNQYEFLNKKNIRSLKPVYFSEKYNYLITKKEDLVSFSTFLKKRRNTVEKKHYFVKLGEVLKDVDIKTGETTCFKRKSTKTMLSHELRLL